MRISEPGQPGSLFRELDARRGINLMPAGQ
jgi:hypothetical protein